MAKSNQEKVKEFYLEKTAKKFEDVLIAAVRSTEEQYESGH
jgi:hypothetical protein